MRVQTSKHLIIQKASTFTIERSISIEYFNPVLFSVQRVFNNNGQFLELKKDKQKPNFQKERSQGGEEEQSFAKLRKIQKVENARKTHGKYLNNKP